MQLVVNKLKESPEFVGIRSSDYNGIVLEFKDDVIVEITPRLTPSVTITFTLMIFSRENNDVFTRVEGLIKELI